MTLQQLHAAIEAYERMLADRVGGQAAFLTALAAVKAARAKYESLPTAVYPLGTFGVQAGRIIVVDAYGVDAFGSVQHAVPVPAALNGTWHAFVGVEAGVHVALFAFHESNVPVPLPALRDLTRQKAWVEVGSVPIDTATCAIADEEGHAPLQVEEEGYRLAGVKSGLCFSNTANADGSYPVFTHMQDGLVKGVYVQFAFWEE
jgi:hypothetical protein